MQRNGLLWVLVIIGGFLVYRILFPPQSPTLSQVGTAWFNNLLQSAGLPPGLPADGMEWRQNWAGQWIQVPQGSPILF